MEEFYKKCIICGADFKVTRMRTCCCSPQCAQEWAHRHTVERRKKRFPEITCANRIPSGDDFRCKATGYLCRPTVRKPHQRFYCLFEPQYAENKQVQRTLKIIQTLKPGIKVSYLIKMNGNGYIKHRLGAQTMTIKEIWRDGTVILEAGSNEAAGVKRKEPRTEARTIHEFFNVLHVDNETFKKAMETALEQEEQQEEERNRGDEFADEVSEAQ